MKLAMFLVLGALIVACGQTEVTENTVNSNNRGIANGSIVPFRDYPKYGAVVGLVMGNALCTGTHIKGGFVLTAWHCIGRRVETNAGANIPFKLISPAGKEGPTSLEVTAEDYKVHLPKAEKFIEVGNGEGGKIKTPQPDLALIEITDGDHLLKLNGIPGADLPSRTLEEGEANIRIAGYGKDSLEGPSMTGRLNAAMGRLEKIEDINYALGWNTGGDVGTALPGDSGGPLFKFGSNGRVEIYGVLSTGGITDVDMVEGRTFPTKHRNHYVRLDRGVVRRWLLDKLSGD
jgi:hypothetical protein